MCVRSAPVDGPPRVSTDQHAGDDRGRRDRRERRRTARRDCDRHQPEPPGRPDDRGDRRQRRIPNRTAADRHLRSDLCTRGLSAGQTRGRASDRGVHRQARRRAEDRRAQRKHHGLGRLTGGRRRVGDAADRPHPRDAGAHPDQPQRRPGAARAGARHALESRRRWQHRRRDPDLPRLRQLGQRLAGHGRRCRDCAVELDRLLGDLQRLFELRGGSGQLGRQRRRDSGPRHLLERGGEVGRQHLPRHVHGRVHEPVADQQQRGRVASRPGRLERRADRTPLGLRRGSRRIHPAEQDLVLRRRALPRQRQLRARLSAAERHAVRHHARAEVLRG
jgi:hypothetical protein